MCRIKLGHMIKCNGVLSTRQEVLTIGFAKLGIYNHNLIFD